MKQIIAFMLFLVIGAASAHAVGMSEQDKITTLLNTLDTPGLIFIRNGEEHDGAWAKKHLQDKLRITAKVVTADDFITKVGSTSSHTGKPYQIKTKMGVTGNSADWFKAHLATIK